MRKRSVAADSAAAHADELFRSRLENQIDLRHPLAKPAGRMPWRDLEDAFASTLPPDPGCGGRPALPVRLMAGLLYLKHAHDLSDEEVCLRWLENPYWQFFTGEVVFQTTLPCNPSSLTRWRQRLGEAGMEELLAQTIAAARSMKAIDTRELSRVIVDTTVQEKAAAPPTDNRLLTVIVGLGYRGREIEGVNILHRGKPKSLTRRQWAWVKRRQAIEPVIGHLKDDCRLRRCHLKGAGGDALHVIACAAGYNIRWLLRWVALLWAWSLAAATRNASSQPSMQIATAA